VSEPPVHIEPEGVVPRPHATGHHLFDLIVAIAAISISLISLFVAIEHGHVERQLVAASSWPFVEADHSNATPSGVHRFSLQISNAGVGPAKLETLELFYDGKPVATPRDLLLRCCGLDPKAPGAKDVQLTTGDVGVLRAGQVVELVGLPQSPEANAPFYKSLDDHSDRMSFRGCYCSVLDECWIGGLQDLRPTPVKACPRPPVPFMGHDFRGAAPGE
jgi:hypothetical protein